MRSAISGPVADAPPPASPPPQARRARPTRPSAVRPSSDAPLAQVSAFVNARQQARVVIDGVDQGPTPMRSRISPGKHRVEIHPETGKVYATTFQVREGVPFVYCHDFASGLPCRR